MFTSDSPYADRTVFDAGDDQKMNPGEQDGGRADSAAKDVLASELLETAAMDGDIVRKQASEPDETDGGVEDPEFAARDGGDDGAGDVGGDKPDENGLVYITATFTVDPDKYVSNNYRPKDKARGAVGGETDEMDALGTPEARESAKDDIDDGITPEMEEAAAKEADELEREAEEEGDSDRSDSVDAEDEAASGGVADYATFIDGSSFLCFDEAAGIDYAKIAMDAGPKKKPAPKQCETTFAQCRAVNPLFCRYHGPRLLEADLSAAIRAALKESGIAVRVTKDKDAASKNTFRLTIGCPPSRRHLVEDVVHAYLTTTPGISVKREGWVKAGKNSETTEFDMDLLKVDEPPTLDKGVKSLKAVTAVQKAVAKEKKMPVVEPTPDKVAGYAAKGELVKEEVSPELEKEWSDAVRDGVYYSKRKNNSLFWNGFKIVAEQYDDAINKKDKGGMEKALAKLKHLFELYDENGNYQGDGSELEAEEGGSEPAEANGQSGGNEGTVVLPEAAPPKEAPKDEPKDESKDESKDEPKESGKDEEDTVTHIDTAGFPPEMKAAAEKFAELKKEHDDLGESDIWGSEALDKGDKAATDEALSDATNKMAACGTAFSDYASAVSKLEAEKEKGDDDSQALLNRGFYSQLVEETQEKAMKAVDEYAKSIAALSSAVADAEHILAFNLDEDLYKAAEEGLMKVINTVFPGKTIPATSTFHSAIKGDSNKFEKNMVSLVGEEQFRDIVKKYGKYDAAKHKVEEIARTIDEMEGTFEGLTEGHVKDFRGQAKKVIDELNALVPGGIDAGQTYSKWKEIIAEECENKAKAMKAAKRLEDEAKKAKAKPAEKPPKKKAPAPTKKEAAGGTGGVKPAAGANKSEQAKAKVSQVEAKIAAVKKTLSQNPPEAEKKGLQLVLAELNEILLELGKLG